MEEILSLFDLLLVLSGLLSGLVLCLNAAERMFDAWLDHREWLAKHERR
jgi:hypothetical protein